MNDNRRRLAQIALLLLSVSLPLLIDPLATLACLLFFMIPSLIVGMRLLSYSAEWIELNRIEYLAWSIVLGFQIIAVLSSLANIIIPGWIGTAYLPLIAALLLLIPACRRFKVCYKMRQRESWDIGVVLLITSLAVSLPFGMIGRDCGDATCYRSYFDNDFFTQLAVAAELSHGTVPPRNPYFSGETLHYYWLPLQATATVFRAARESVTLESIHRSQCIMIGYLFVVILLRLTACLVSSPPFRTIGVVLLILSSSFEGAFLWFRNWTTNDAIGHYTTFNIDGLSRLLWEPPLIDSLYRGLLFTPQHLLGLCLLMMLMIIQMERHSESESHWVVFVLLTSILLNSVFMAAAGFFWLGAAELFNLIKTKKWRWTRYATAILAGIVSVGLAMQFGMITAHPGDVYFGFRISSLSALFAILFLNFGAVPILSLGGIWAAQAHDRNHTIPIALMAAIGYGFVFFVSMSGYPNEFGLRGGFIVLVASTPLVTSLLALLFQNRNRVSKISAAFLVALLAPGIMTTIYDVLNFTDIQNPAYTCRVDRDTRTALDWIRKNTESKAIIQNDPSPFSDERFGAIPNLIPPLAQRCLAVGPEHFSGQFQVGRHVAREKIAVIESALRAEHLLDPIELFYTDGIQYWLIGPDESAKYPLILSAMTESPFTFSVYNSRHHHVFRVEPMDVPGEIVAVFSANPAESLEIRHSNDRVMEKTQGLNHSVVSGFRKQKSEPDWVFTRDELMHEEVWVSERRFAFITFDLLNPIDELTIRLHFLSCDSDRSQRLRIVIDSMPSWDVDLEKGWHDYTLDVAGLEKGQHGMWFAADFVETTREICDASFTIGATSVSSPLPLMVRVGQSISGEQYADIFYDYKNISFQRPGWNMVSISPEGTLDSVYPDRDQKIGHTPTTWIESVSDGQIIAGVAGRDIDSCFDDSMIAALHDLGCTLDPRSRICTGYGFIGAKGSPAGSAMEVMPETLTDFIFVGPNQGDMQFSFAFEGLYPS